jgi:hypothetical protein
MASSSPNSTYAKCRCVFPGPWTGILINTICSATSQRQRHISKMNANVCKQLTPAAASPKNSRISSSVTGTGRCFIYSVHGFLDPRRPTGVCDPPLALAVSATGDVGSGTGPSAVTDDNDGGASPFDLLCSPLWLSLLLWLSAGLAVPLPFAPVLEPTAATLAASLFSFSFCFLFSFLLRSLSPEPFAWGGRTGAGDSLGAGVAGLGVGALGGAGLRVCCGAGAGAEIVGGAGVGAFEGGPGVPTLDGALDVGNLATPMGLPDGSCGFGVVVPPTAGTGAGAA